MNKALACIQPSATLAISALAKQLAEDGEHVCNFAAGEPDFDTPQIIKDACVKALADGMTKYTPARGLQALCKAVAAKFKADNGLDYSADNVIISGGGKMSLSTAFTALLNPGDEVVIPAPYWLSYPEMVRIAGGVPVPVMGDEAHDFKVTPEQLEAAMTPKTVAVVINSPSNPTGLVYTRDELKALGDVCVRHQVWILSDEIYERMVYGGAEHVSIASLSDALFERTLTVNGVSKAYSMTGWRIGYAAGPKALISAMTTVQSHLASAPATFAQVGALHALTRAEAEIAPMIRAFEERNALIYGLLSEIKGIVCTQPMGAFYIFPNVGAFGMDAGVFAERLIREKHVAAVPGDAFGAPNNLRFSYACSTDEIREGMSRLKAFCDGL